MENEKYYVVTQINAIGHGSTTTVALVTNPQIQGAGIRATKVGIPDWDRCKAGHQHVFKPIPPVDFIVVGNATCEECVEPPFSTNIESEVSSAFDED